MPTISVTVTASREYTVPSGYVEMDAEGKAKGGQGGPGEEIPGPGGGEGGKWSFTKMPVQAGRTFNLQVDNAITAIEEGVDYLKGYAGGPASGSSPGTGGTTAQHGFPGATRINGDIGKAALGVDGGDGGGQVNHGTPTQAPGGGSYGKGGGGQGQNGPPFSPSQGGAPGGPPIIMLTLRDFTTA